MCTGTQHAKQKKKYWADTDKYGSLYDQLPKNV